MTCREAGPLLHARLDNELDMAGAASIDLHLSECRACAAQYAALENLHEEIAAADLAYAPGAALERKLAARFLRREEIALSFVELELAQCVRSWPPRRLPSVLIVSIPMLRIGEGHGRHRRRDSRQSFARSPTDASGGRAQLGSAHRQALVSGQD